MAKDIRYEILKTLFENENEVVDLRPMIMDLINKGQASRTKLNTLLYKLREQNLIAFGHIGSLNTKVNGVYFEDHLPINVKLDYLGIDEYHRLKKQYSNDSSPNMISIGGNFQGNINQGNNATANQTSNEESAEGLQIAHSTLKVSKKMLNWVIATVVVMVLIFLIPYLISKNEYKKPVLNLDQGIKYVQIGDSFLLAFEIKNFGDATARNLEFRVLNLYEKDSNIALGPIREEKEISDLIIPKGGTYTYYLNVNTKDPNIEWASGTYYAYFRLAYNGDNGDSLDTLRHLTLVPYPNTNTVIFDLHTDKQYKIYNVLKQLHLY
jgi:hypothetical protein